jgi:hypothetical protein
MRILGAPTETCKICEDLPSKSFYKAYEDSPPFVATLGTLPVQSEVCDVRHIKS